MTDERLPFVACEKRYCQTIIIINDNEVEKNKKFRVTLTKPTGLDNRISISTPRADVIIIDDDGMCHNPSGVLVHALMNHFSISCYSEYGGRSLPNLRGCR